MERFRILPDGYPGDVTRWRRRDFVYRDIGDTTTVQWTMTFDGKGKLLKATHIMAPKSEENVIQRTPVEVQGQLVPQRQ
jgi:hypothetical protein